MMDTGNEHDPFSENRENSKSDIATSNRPAILYKVPGQIEFIELVDQFYALFWELPSITTLDVDVRLKAMYDTLLRIAPAVGVSRISIPEWKECCGRKRVWPPGLLLAGESPPSPVESLGWRLGDIVRRITRFFKIRPCDGCERRRLWLNRLFQKKG